MFLQHYLADISGINRCETKKRALCTMRPILLIWSNTGCALTRTDHVHAVQPYFGYRRAKEDEVAKGVAWLVQRTLEDDQPSLFFELACQQLSLRNCLAVGAFGVLNHAYGLQTYHLACNIGCAPRVKNTAPACFL